MKWPLRRIAFDRKAPARTADARDALATEYAQDLLVELGIDELEARLATDHPGSGGGNSGGGGGGGQVGWGC
jgi:hypothetical protein